MNCLHHEGFIAGERSVFLCIDAIELCMMLHTVAQDMQEFDRNKSRTLPRPKKKGKIADPTPHLLTLPILPSLG